MFGHALDHAAEALGIGVVQRRVDLVEQAERRRIELEEREHQRRRGKRFLAPRQQVNRALALAGWLRHDQHARIENLVEIVTTESAGTPTS